MIARSGFFKLTERTLLAFSGPDASRYLNGQLSINIPQLAPLMARPACLLDAKGRLCAHLHLWRDADRFIIEAPTSRLEEIQARLERYIIADDVTLTLLPDSPTYHVFGIPAPVGSLAINRLGIPGYDTPTTPVDLPEANPADIERLRITHGIPAWGLELTATTLPHEARLEDTSIDFDKGCYIGQEIVSRLKSVAHVNKRLLGFRGILPLPLPDNCTLHTSGSDAPAGRLTSATQHFDMAQSVALGYLNRQFESADQFHVRDHEGRDIGSVERQPFPIP
jgi:tRNA-modifying protein YgfZ